jgi:hypothetical protein
MFPKPRVLTERQKLRAKQAVHLTRISKEQDPIEKTPAWTPERLSAMKEQHWIDGRAQNATQRFFGDPLPGRSALDHRRRGGL